MSDGRPPFGLLKLGVLKMLKNSARYSMRVFSLMEKLLNMEKSRLRKPGSVEHVTSGVALGVLGW